MKNKYYVIIIAFIAILVFSTASICDGCGKGKETQTPNTVQADVEREVTWITEDDTSSAEPEDVEDLEKAGTSNYKLLGMIESPYKGSITLFTSSDSNILNGEAVEMGWYEYIYIEGTSSEGSGEEDHHHDTEIYCLIVFSGNVWGKIDEAGKIYADLGGEKRVKYAFSPRGKNVIDENLTEMAQNTYQIKPDSFTVEGNYYNNVSGVRADGKINPNNYSWQATDYTSK